MRKWKPKEPYKKDEKRLLLFFKLTFVGAKPKKNSLNSNLIFFKWREREWEKKQG